MITVKRLVVFAFFTVMTLLGFLLFLEFSRNGDEVIEPAPGYQKSLDYTSPAAGYFRIVSYDDGKSWTCFYGS